MRTLLATALITLVFAGCASNTDESPSPTTSDTAYICTNFGPITVKLYTEQAPITAANFANLAASGSYDNVLFHRIIPNFMMQGGDPTGTGSGGEAFGGGNIPDEFHPDLRHNKPGILSMANAGANTGSSQFFITFLPQPSLDNKHSVFGEVQAGMDVVQAIEEAAATPSGTPTVRVFMHTVLTEGTATDCPPSLQPYNAAPPYACQNDSHTTDAKVDTNLITPGVLCITNTQDQSLAWARNFGSNDIEGTFSLTGPDGSNLPKGWVATFDDPTITLGAAGSRKETDFSVLEIRVPAGTNGSFPLELHTGAAMTKITGIVDLRHDILTKVGTVTAVEYSGSCTRSPTESFDEGVFSLAIGGGRAIVGFDLGLIGMGESEAATLVLPAPMAYGYGGGPCSGEEADLQFDVSVKWLHPVPGTS